MCGVVVGNNSDIVVRHTCLSVGRRQALGPYITHTCSQSFSRFLVRCCVTDGASIYHPQGLDERAARIWYFKRPRTSTTHLMASTRSHEINQSRRNCLSKTWHVAWSSSILTCLLEDTLRCNLCPGSAYSLSSDVIPLTAKFDIRLLRPA
jgi:hypothetical protein